MKACLVLQRRFAYLGHDLALLLKEEHGVESICAYVSTRESFRYLKRQHEIEYTSLILDEDIQKKFTSEVLDLDYLRDLEKRCGNLWKYINVDRVIRQGQLVREYPYDQCVYTHEELLRILQSYAKRLTVFLDEERPDFVLCYQPGAMGQLLLCALAENRGIPVIYIVPSMTKDRIILSRKYDSFTWVEDILAEQKTKTIEELPGYTEAVQYLETFSKKPVIYSNVYDFLIRHGRLKQFTFLFPRNALRSVGWIFRMTSDWLFDKEKRTDYTTIHPFFYIYDHAKRKIRSMIGADDLYDAYDSSASFVFCPLHFEPELSILLLARFDTDQVAVVKRVAQSLPVGMLVYVKEHPQMAAYRPRSFYRKLKAIPNVRLLRPELSGFDIIRDSKLVTIISGSAGWEACLLGKPVITFGDVFYNILPSVIRADVHNELPAIIERQLSARWDKEQVVRLLAAIFEDSAKGDLYYMWEIEADRTRKREHLADFAGLLMTKIALSKRRVAV